MTPSRGRDPVKLLLQSRMVKEEVVQSARNLHVFWRWKQVLERTGQGMRAKDRKVRATLDLLTRATGKTVSYTEMDEMLGVAVLGQGQGSAWPPQCFCLAEF